MMLAAQTRRQVRVRASAKVLKRGFVLQALGKTLLISRQAGAHQMMHAPVAKFVHLLHGFFRSPTLLSHAIGCNHHTCAVIAKPAVHEDFLARMFSRDFYEPFEHFIFGKGAIPR